MPYTVLVHAVRHSGKWLMATALSVRAVLWVWGAPTMKLVEPERNRFAIPSQWKVQWIVNRAIVLLFFILLFKHLP